MNPDQIDEVRDAMRIIANNLRLLDSALAKSLADIVWEAGHHIDVQALRIRKTVRQEGQDPAPPPE